MKILLIHPPYYVLTEESAPGMPLGLLSMATVLYTKGHTVLVYDMDFEKNKIRRNIKMDISLLRNNYFSNLENEDFYVWSNLKKVISDFSPDIVGVSFIVPEIESAFQVAKTIRKLNKNILLVAGGRMATVMPYYVLKQYDVVVRGEGENTLLQLVEYLSKCKKTGKSFFKFFKFSKIAGISYKYKNKIIHNKKRALIDNLSNLPQINRDLLLNCKDYPSQLFGYIYASRGCFFNCNFCTAQSLWGTSVRFRKVDDIISEISFLKKKYNTHEFHFVDDFFTSDRNWAIDFCKKLIRTNNNIYWHCITRADFLDDHLLHYMKKSGCISISLGVESGSHKLLTALNKSISLEKINEITSKIKSHGILVQYFLMMGYPDETEKSIGDTFNLIKRANPDFFSVAFFTPFPGSRLFDKMKTEKLIATYNFTYYNLYYPVLKVKKLSFEKLIFFHNEFKKLSNKSEVSFYRSFFMNPKYLLFKSIETFKQPRVFILFLDNFFKLIILKKS
jgi:anaerobic magnesium-protoporphyrin IX monomethyl ester cyclase